MATACAGTESAAKLKVAIPFTSEAGSPASSKAFAHAEVASSRTDTFERRTSGVKANTGDRNGIQDAPLNHEPA